jgi:NADH:ubiquinone oxidoreductase subunit F (NADH-binding)
VLKLAGRRRRSGAGRWGQRPDGRPDGYDRKVCFDDLATGGSIMVFGSERNMLEVANRFMEFFIEESCGYCTPCRVGNVLLKERLEKILAGRGEPATCRTSQELGRDGQGGAGAGWGRRRRTRC